MECASHLSLTPHRAFCRVLANSTKLFSAMPRSRHSWSSGLNGEKNHIITLTLNVMLEIKNLPDVEADNLIAVRLVERILIHMIAISFTQNTSLSSFCIQVFQSFDITVHSICAILFDLKRKKMDVNTLQYGDRLIEGPSIPSSQTFPQNVGKVPCLPLAKPPKLVFHLGLAQPFTKKKISM